MQNFWLGFEKKASGWATAAELGGLGTLAIPSVQQLRGKKMKDSTTSKLEIAGLGTLAAPYIANGIKKFPALARTAKSIVTKGRA